MGQDEFLDLLRRSGLVEEDRLTRFLSALPKDAQGESYSEIESLSKALVDGGILTHWQAEKLAQRKFKGFFLDYYKLLRHLCKGGMSQMYMAEHTVTKRRVRIKVLPRSDVQDSSELDRFGAKESDGKVRFIVLEECDDNGN
jgi:serine/threonine protein kinase